MKTMLKTARGASGALQVRPDGQERAGAKMRRLKSEFEFENSIESNSIRPPVSPRALQTRHLLQDNFGRRGGDGD